MLPNASTQRSQEIVSSKSDDMTFPSLTRPRIDAALGPGDDDHAIFVGAAGDQKACQQQQCFHPILHCPWLSTHTGVAKPFHGVKPAETGTANANAPKFTVACGGKTL